MNSQIIMQCFFIFYFQRLDLVRGAFTWHCCIVCRYECTTNSCLRYSHIIQVSLLYVWIIYRKEKAIAVCNTPTCTFSKKLFNWFDLFISASRWITHDLWSSISSLFRVSQLDMDNCCMHAKTVLWSWSLTFLR